MHQPFCYANYASFFFCLSTCLTIFWLLNEESSHNPLADTPSAARATVGTGDGLLVLGDTLVEVRAKSGEPLEDFAAVSALDTGSLLAHVVEREHATRRLHLANLVRLGGVRMTTTVCK